MIRVRATVAGLTVAIVLTACSSSSHTAVPATSTTSSVPTTTTAKAVSPARAAALVREAGSNARAQGWVHLDITVSGSGKTVVYRQDSGLSGGRQTVTIGTERATVVELNGVAYVNADAPALHDYLGLPSSSASFAGKWLSIRPTDNQYVAVTAGVSLGDVLKRDLIAAPFAVTAAVVDGRRVDAIRGTARTAGGAPVSATLFVPVSGTVLPVAFDLTDGTVTSRSVFSRWGIAGTLTVPPNPIAFSSIVSSGV
jgi:hypothetical protein